MDYKLIRPYLLWKGRINRKPYFFTTLYSYLSFSLLGVFVAISYNNSQTPLAILLTTISILPFYIFVCAFIKRLHDVNLSGWFIFGLILPIANLVMFVALLIKSSSTGPNKYGESPLMK